MCLKWQSNVKAVEMLHARAKQPNEPPEITLFPTVDFLLQNFFKKFAWLPREFDSTGGVREMGLPAPPKKSIHFTEK